MAIFLLGVLAFLRLAVFVPSATKEQGVFGGPIPVLSPEGPLNKNLALLLSNAPVGLGGQADQTLPAGGGEAEHALLADSATGVLAGSEAQGSVITYKVQKGDNLGRIAKQFGISLNTLLGANPGVRPGTLKEGQALEILPVSGIVYRVKDGETAESVAAQYDLTVTQLRTFNPSINFADLGTGISLILPGATAKANDSQDGQSLPYLKDYFIMPTEGFDWGVLHNYNAVDIANACGTPVNAAADGLVTDYGAPLYFNGGYGGFVLIEHPNGTKTRYAHLDELAAQLGDYVKQGQKVGEMGNTGNVHGPTGCHLHFEVYGAQNPFSK